MAALKQPTIRVVAIIAEGVPEADAKQLIAYARANNKVKKWSEIMLGELDSNVQFSRDKHLNNLSLLCLTCV